MKKRYIPLLICILFICNVCPSWAASLSYEDMGALSWQKIWQDPLQANGNVQGMCATDYYIIMIENVADDPNVPDVVTAYYKYDHDEFGNPVQQYSVAKRVASEEWEHGNGMAWNPNTNEIYVALYTNTIPENHGCLYVMDPNTLMHTRTVKVTDDFNILGISYQPEVDHYIIQSDAEGQYRFQVLDGNFNLLWDMGLSDISPGVNSQDMCSVQDFIINSPCGGGNFANIYSISNNEKVSSVEVALDEPNLDVNYGFEIESFAELEPGHVLMAARSSQTDGLSYASFYEAYLPVETVETAPADPAASLDESGADPANPEEVFAEPLVIASAESAEPAETATLPFAAAEATEVTGEAVMASEGEETAPESASADSGADGTLTKTEKPRSELGKAAIAVTEDEKGSAKGSHFRLSAKLIVIAAAVAAAMAASGITYASWRVRLDRERRRRLAMRRRERTKREILERDSGYTI